MLDLVKEIQFIPSSKIDPKELPANLNTVLSSMRTILDNTKLDYILGPHIGIYQQIIMFRNFNDIPYFVAFNPRIIDTSPEKVMVKETDIRRPYVNVNVTRPEGVRCRITDLNGEVKTLTLVGKNARLMQIAYDLLNNIDFMTRLNYINKEQAKRQIKKYSRSKE